ncbi:hypothetical protein EON81_11455 [bacterium]|nr:MAG: hypothetical protein EON81_11455 [bacterium]
MMKLAKSIPLFALLLLAGCGGSSTGGGGTTDPDEMTITVTANPSTIRVGESSTVTWVSTNAKDVVNVVSMPVKDDPYPLSGSGTVTPTETIFPSIRVRDGSGNLLTGSTTITVLPAE